MSKGSEKILRGAAEALAHARGETTEGFVVRIPDLVDVKRVRTSLGLTQSQFARRFGFDVASIRNWEQGRRQPEGPARVFLTVIEHEPEAVERASEGSRHFLCSECVISLGYGCPGRVEQRFGTSSCLPLCS